MWKVDGTSVFMTEGDYGVELPIVVSGTTVSTTDAALFTVKDTQNGTAILQKTLTNIQQNKIIVTLSEAESALLAVGMYVWTLDWYRDGIFLCNLVPAAAFQVVDKA